MKKLFFTLLILLFALPAYAQQCSEETPCPELARLMVVGGNVPVSGATYPDILFWFNGEANDTTGDYNMGASECVATGGDTSGTYTSLATISTGPAGACKVGTYCFHASSTNDGLAFTSTSVMLGTKGRIGFWVYITTWSADTLFFYIVDTVSDSYFRLKLSGVDELSLRWRVSGATETESATVDANMSVATWYFVEIAYDTTLDVNDYVDVYVNGTRRSNDKGALSTMILGSILLGSPDTDIDPYIDNVMTSNDPTRDLYESGTGLSVATTKPSGACP